MITDTWIIIDRLGNRRTVYVPRGTEPELGINDFYALKATS